MNFNQDTKTKKFVEQVKNLVNKGVEPTYKAIAERIGWHSNSLSVALKGGRNVPFEIYKKFLEIYKLEDAVKEKADSDESAYKERYIALLEQQIKEKERALIELKERMDSRTLQLMERIEQVSANLAEHDRNAKIALGYCKFLYQRWGPLEFRLNQMLQTEKKSAKDQEREKQALDAALDGWDSQLVQLLEAELMQEKGN